MYICQTYFNKYLYTYNIAYVCMYVCMYVYDIKCVDFSKYKFIKNWMNENINTFIYIVCVN